MVSTLSIGSRRYLVDIGFVQAQVSEHFLQQSRSDLFRAVLHNSVAITRIEGAVTAFAPFPDKVQLETTLPGDFPESLEEFVSVHENSVGQNCPHFNKRIEENNDWLPHSSRPHAIFQFPQKSAVFGHFL
jgi:hypothetical protein